MATKSTPRPRAAEPATADDSITVVVPKPFILNADDGKQHTYQAGTQEMPRSHAEHWWSVANGVAVYTKE